MKKPWTPEKISGVVFAVTTVVLLVLFTAWVVFAFHDLAAAIGLLFIAAAILVGVILVLLAAAWIADCVGDIISDCMRG